MQEPVEIPSEQERDDPERFDPAESGGRLVDAEHRARYLLARQLVSGRRVLDAACGTGYGTRTLMDGGATEVAALDIAPEAVEETRRRTRGEANVVQASLYDMPFDDDSFDVVVCLEAIEHVRHPDRVLTELGRVLAPDGLLVLSSPNRGVYPPGNPHHIHEYTSAELADALAGQFSNVSILRQHAWLASAVDAPAFDNVPEVARLARVEAGDETYAVALASNAPLPEVAGQLVLADAFEVGWWHEQLAEREGQLAERDGQLAEQAGDLAKARHDAGEAQALAAEIGSRLIDLESANAELNDLRRRFEEVTDERRRYDVEVREVLEEKDAEIERAQSTVASMQASVSWKLTRPLRALKRFARQG